MNLGKMHLASWALVLSALLNTASAGAVSLSPTSNVSVGFVDDPDNPGFVAQGGTLAGMSNWMIVRAYEQFFLPAYVPGTQVTLADFNSYYCCEEGAEGALGVYATSNAWDGHSIDADHQPAPQNLLASLDPTPGQTFHVDLTAYINQAYKNGGVVSFVIMHSPDVSTYDIRTLSVAKQLDLTISAVPEPASYGMLLAGLGWLAWRNGRRRQRGPV